jgi:hypothetical protein
VCVISAPFSKNAKQCVQVCALLGILVAI